MESLGCSQLQLQLSPGPVRTLTGLGKGEPELCNETYTHLVRQRSGKSLRVIHEVGDDRNVQGK